MIGTDRSYEHRSYAVNRAHLQPVTPLVVPARGMSEMRQGLLVGWLIGFAIITGLVLKGFGL